jgi:hypothetical protein
MATKFFDNNGIVNFDSISSEEDLVTSTTSDLQKYVENFSHILYP